MFQGYGIPMRLNSEYKKYIDSAILHLKEGGVLHRQRRSRLLPWPNLIES